MAILKDKIAIITGASSGIGYATAKLFAAEGANVIVGARRSDKLDDLVEEINRSGKGKAMALAGDVKDETYAKDLVRIATTEFGGLDIAFNNAGTIGVSGTNSEDISLEDWNKTLSANLTSAFLGAKHQLPEMLKRGKGSIIFTASVVGYTFGFPQMAPYAASKAGMIGLTQALATEYGSRGIRVNALLPGGVDTPMSRAVINTPEALESLKELHALKRLAEPGEIAQTALYLASDASGFTTGSALIADGGISICKT